MSRQQLSLHYARLLTRWPIDRLRPEKERHFQSLLRKRIAASPAGHEAFEEREVNTAYLLLDDTFAKQYRLPERIMKPASNPRYYEDLARELEEAPGRSWWGNLVKRVSGMVRFR